MSGGENRALHIFCVVLATCTFILIIAGGLVTSNNAGLSVPDWPRSYGRWMPDMVGGVFYEHGHRMIAAVVGLLTLILNGLLFLVKADRALKRLGLIALAAIVVQAMLGGFAVLLKLPVMMSVLHASLAQAFFCLVVSLALFTSRSWPPAALRGQADPAHVKYSNARLLTFTLFTQLFLGALLRHSGTIDGVKATQVNVWALAGHLLGALAVVVMIVTIVFPALRQGSTGLVGQACRTLLGLVFVQLGLGVGALVIRLDSLSRPQPVSVEVAIMTGHLAIGALMLAASLTLSLLCRSSHMGTGGLHPSKVS